MTDPSLSPDDRALPTFCPFCGRKNDRHQSVHEPATPEPGDVGVCWGCSNVFVFETSTRPRRPTPEEQAELDDDPEVALAREVMHESHTPTEAVTLARAVTRRVTDE